MRPGNNSTSGGFNGGLGHGNSPVPYLFCGLGLTLVLIGIALTILSCSGRQSRTTSAGGDRDHQGEEKSVNKQAAAMQSEMEPKIVVIMAGDDNPTYLAKPAASSSACTCQQTPLNSTHLTSPSIA